MNKDTSQLALYHLELCPYCIATRKAIDALNLEIELRDIKKEKQYKQELIEGGGKSQVPCLRIDDEGSSTWMYESTDILQYLENHYT